MIIQNNCLNEEQIAQLTQLFDDCVLTDGTTPQIYWEIIKHSRLYPGNFLYYEDQFLVGYLGFFFFDGNNSSTTEMTALVHPNYRRKHVFQKLFHAACAELSKYKIPNVIFSFPSKNEMAKMCVTKLGGEFSYCEYHMERSNVQHEIIESNTISLQLATEHDVPLIATIDCSCFQGDYQKMFDRFQETIWDPARHVYLAYLNNQCIGKAHVHATPEGIGVHNICVVPFFQNKGYGTILLKLVINEILDTHVNAHSTSTSPKLYLDVTATNESALNLYKKCHFEITDTYEYWSVSNRI